MSEGVMNEQNGGSKEVIDAGMDETGIEKRVPE